MALTAAAGAALLAWGLVEARRVEWRRVELGIDGLPLELDGLTIAHLSDLHLGSLSLNGRVLAAAARWVQDAAPDFVVLTGDLLARQRGEQQLCEALSAFRPRFGTFAVLGNVDIADTRDPFSSATTLTDLGPNATLLEDGAVRVDVGGRSVQLVGCAPTSQKAPPVELADPNADLRILLAHFPDSADFVPTGAFHLLLAGHTHGGQICLPYPGGKARFGGFSPPYPEGVFHLGGTTLVVSRGLGTTFVPFRFFARPEASLLVLRRRTG